MRGDVDPAACDAVLICEEVAADFRTVFTTGLTIRTGAISGTVTIDSTDPGRAPHCAYDVTLTPM